MPDQGYLQWAYRIMAGPMYLDGELLTAAGRAYPASYATGPAGNLLSMAGGASVLQLQWTAPTLPVSRRPIPSQINFVVSDGDIYQRLLRASSSGLPLRLFIGTWVCDTWLQSAAADAQTTWRMSRRLPYALPSIVRTGDSHWGPLAWVNGVEQEVLATGTPAAGQVTIPSSGDYYGTATTPAASTLAGDLQISYPAEFFVRLTVGHTFDVANALGIALTIEELLP